MALIFPIRPRRGAAIHRRARAGADPRRTPCAIERACAALPADFPAEMRDSMTAGARSRRALIKATASK